MTESTPDAPTSSAVPEPELPATPPQVVEFVRPPSRPELEWLVVLTVVVLPWTVPWLLIWIGLPVPGRAESDTNDPVSQFATLLGSLAVLVPVLYAMGRSGATWSFFGVRRLRIGLDLVLTVLYFAADRLAHRIASGLCRIVPFEHWLPGGTPASQWLGDVSRTRLLAISSIVVSSVAQELVYRGFMVSVIHHQLRSRVAAVLIPALLFALIHLYQGPKGVVGTFLMGIAYGLGFVLCRRVWPLAAAHACTNVIAVLRA